MNLRVGCVTPGAAPSEPFEPGALGEARPTCALRCVGGTASTSLRSPFRGAWFLKFGWAWLCGAVSSSSATSAASVEITIADSRRDQLLPCVLYLKDAGGQPVRAEGAPFFRDHFACTGRVSVPLAPGSYTYQIEHGPEWTMASGTFAVGTNQKLVLNARLERLANLSSEGWWCGELHVHRPIADVPLLMRAADLHVAPVITWWNKQNLWASRRPDKRLVQFDQNRFYHLMGGEDEREGGALLYFQLDEPLSIAGASREYPSSAKFLADARKHPGAWADIEKPFWYDVPLWLATGVDSVGLACNHMLRDGMYESEAWGRARDPVRLPPPRGNGFYTQEIYYQILNAGFRLPPTAGSASGVMQNPVGYNRVYVYVGGQLTWDKWWEGLRAGRCFVSNGPLLRARANGQLPGHVFVGEKTVAVDLDLALTTRDPISSIEVIVNGRVARVVSAEEWQRARSVGKLQLAESGWFLVRTMADNPKTFRFASTAPWYVEIGGQKQRISRTAAQSFLDWARERINRIKLDDPAQREEVLFYHRAAEEFWKQKLAQSNAE